MTKDQKRIKALEKEVEDLKKTVMELAARPQYVYLTQMPYVPYTPPTVTPWTPPYYEITCKAGNLGINDHPNMMIS